MTHNPFGLTAPAFWYSASQLPCKRLPNKALQAPSVARQSLGCRMPLPSLLRRLLQLIRFLPFRRGFRFLALPLERLCQSAVRLHILRILADRLLETLNRVLHLPLLQQ